MGLTAAVSEGGGLGSFGLYGYDPDRIRATAHALKEATSKPYALNLWLPIPGEEPPQPDEAEFAAYVEVLRPYFEAVGSSRLQGLAGYLPDVEGQIQAALEAAPAVLSFVFGVPSQDVIDAAHARGIIVMGTATTVEEALALEKGGVDAIVASGMEAGGHKVSFLDKPENSLIGTFSLVPQVADAVAVPVVAAGGVADGRGVAAALTLGADAVQIGSAFLATKQSAASSGYRSALQGPGTRQTVLTRAYSGRLGRGIPNRIAHELTDPRLHAPFPIQNWLTGQFRTKAAQLDIPELMSLWAGQSAPLIASALDNDDDAGHLMQRIVDSTSRILDGSS
ncbi:NAD(P)H-dependent flavin oxidoreductase [Arthrobacter sp. SA17]